MKREKVWVLLSNGINYTIIFLLVPNLVHFNPPCDHMYLSHRYECFIVKYTTCRFHMKLHPGYKWRFFHILTSEDIADVTPLFSPCTHFGAHCSRQ